MNEQYDPYQEYRHKHPMYLKGVEDEQQRIIALIEKRADDCYEKDWSGGWSFSTELLIALIKGENE